MVASHLANWSVCFCRVPVHAFLARKTLAQKRAVVRFPDFFVTTLSKNARLSRARRRMPIARDREIEASCYRQFSAEDKQILRNGE